MSHARLDLRDKLLWPNFVASVWLLIGLGLVQLAWNLANWQTVTSPPFRAKSALAPFALAFIECALWFALYRHRGNGTRVMAGVVGAMVLLQLVFVPLVWLGLYDIPLRPRWVLYLYSSGVHLLVAAVGFERRADADA